MNGEKYVYSFRSMMPNQTTNRQFDDMPLILPPNFNVIRIMRGMADINYDDPPEKRLKASVFAYYDIQKTRNMMLFYREPEEEMEFAEFLFEFNKDTFQKVGMSKIARIAELLHRSRSYIEDNEDNIWIMAHFTDLKRSFELMREKVEIDFPETRMVSKKVWDAVCEKNKHETCV
jgi:hypothetical protein